MGFRNLTHFFFIIILLGLEFINCSWNNRFKPDLEKCLTVLRGYNKKILIKRNKALKSLFER